MGNADRTFPIPISLFPIEVLRGQWTWGNIDLLGVHRHRGEMFTELFVRSVAMFCYVFQGKLRGPAWAVGSCSVSQSAGGMYHYIIFKTLRQTR